MKKAMIPFLLTLALFSGCTKKDRLEGLAEMEAMEQRFAQTVSIAEITPRVGLPAYVAELQSIARELHAVKTSGCLSEAKNSLEKHMDLTAQSILSFVGNDPQKRENLLQQSRVQLDAYRSNVRKCREDPRD